MQSNRIWYENECQLKNIFSKARIKGIKGLVLGTKRTNNGKTNAYNIFVLGYGLWQIYQANGVNKINARK